MIVLSLKNIESFLFENKILRNSFPEFKHYFDQWELARHHSFLRNKGVQSIIDLLNNLNEDHLKKMEKFYNVKFMVKKINDKLVYNSDFEIDEKFNNLPIMSNFCIYRNKEKVFITSWG